MFDPNTVLMMIAKHVETAAGRTRDVSLLELKTKIKRKFAKFSIVPYSRPSLMINASASQFYVYLPWGQSPFSIVS